MLNVFIAVGGSGTKVAEALVRLLAAGCPTREEGGTPTSLGDTLQLWRLDPDRSAGAGMSLQSCVDNYKLLQEHLGGRWSMTVDTDIRHLDPLQLPEETRGNNRFKTLGGILNSGVMGKEDSSPYLNLLYAPKDLAVNVERGFYQKPFIGSAVMAVFANSLEDGNSPGGRKCQLNRLENEEVRFFLCGSLHGGTGACGVPIMGRFLSSRNERINRKWQIAACLLAPYSLPPEPPFKSPDPVEEVTSEMLEEVLSRPEVQKAFGRMNEEERIEVTKQVLLGFYANPKDIVARARQSLDYYKDISEWFDQIYLVGKPEPDQLAGWSNGGKHQNNPLNSAEVVAALTALNFFSNTKLSGTGTYATGSSTPTLDSHNMHLYDLPRYAIDEKVPVDPEKVLLATAIAIHLVVQQIRWGLDARLWRDIDELRKVYETDSEKQQADFKSFDDAAKLLTDYMLSLVDPAATKGWHPEEFQHLQELVSDDPVAVRRVAESLKEKNWYNLGEKKPATLGKSSVKITTAEFGQWFPFKEGMKFNRGDYFRHVWAEVYKKIVNKA
ncbi:MAG: hypothetical protein ABW250_02630 [Pyrinomonadaceae bacterium]